MATNISEWRDGIREDVMLCPNPIIDKSVIEVIRRFCQVSRIWTETLTPIDVVAIQASDIAFVAGSPGTITTSSGDFVAAGFTAGDKLTTDSELNPGTYTIDTGGVAVGTLTLISSDDLVNESAGQAFTVAKNFYPITRASAEIINVTQPVEFVSNDDGGRHNVWPVSEWQMNQGGEYYHADFYSDYKDFYGWGSKLSKVSTYGWKRHAAAFPSRYLMSDTKELRLYPMPIESRTNALNVSVTLKPSRTATTVEDFLYNDYMEIIEHGTKARLLRMSKQPWFDMEMSGFHAGEFDRGLTKGFNTARYGRTDMVQRSCSA
jgi:hypothetical protein